MALIGTIRKNFWFVLILLGFALAAFILMDMTGASSGAGGATSMTMGSVGGQKIDYRTFQQTEQAYYANAGSDAFSKRKSIWDFYVQDALLNKEGNKLGFNVSKEELMDLQFGPNPSQIIRSNWTDQATGQLSLQNLNEIKGNIESGEPMNPQFRAYWAEQEKQIIKDRMQQKLTNLVSKAVYTPNWMAEESFKLDNDKIDVNFVKIPFDNIQAGDVTVSDADIANFISTDKNRYEVNEETRVVEFATFNVVPSAADSMSIREKLNLMRSDFTASVGDSLFTVTNSGTYSHLYARGDQLPEGARSQITNLNPGEVYGPFAQNGIYLLVKMLDKKRVADTVEARHILKRADRTNPAAVATARTFIDSLKRELNRGISFDTLAARHSDDQSNAARGGDLGRFTQETMVPEFATACFANGKEGGVYTVVTDFGVHLLKVEDKVYNDEELKYRVASIAQPIVPSQETQDLEYDRVTEVISANRDIASLRTAIENDPNIFLEKSVALKANDYNVGALGATQSSREMIKWAFDPSTELGDVSPEIFRYTDQINYYDNKYVLVSLNSIVPKGLPTAASMRSTLETRVLNKLKGEKFASGFNFANIDEAASSQGVTVQNASDITPKASTITGIGNEPEVLAAIFSTPVQAVSKPIVGNTGVFVVQPLSRIEPGAPTNLPLVKTNVAQSTKSQLGFSLIQNMTKRADIEDERSTFF